MRLRRLALCLILLLALCAPAWGTITLTNPQDTALIYPKFHATDPSTGAPLVGGKVYTYHPGTSTLQTTFSNPQLTAANMNPVVLDASGEALIYAASPKKLKLTRANGTQIWVVDNVGGTNASLGTNTIYPEDYGALGDGSHDDTDNIKAANAALSSAGGTVHFSNKNYKIISSQITLPDYVNWEGAGPGSVISCAPAAFSPMITLASHHRITGLTFDGGGSWTSTPFVHPGSASNSVGFTTDTQALYAPSASSCTDIQVDHCIFTGLEHGVYGYFNDSRIANNYFYNMGMSAIGLYGSSGVDLVANDINGVHGNITAAGDTTVADSKFADGVLFQSCVRCTQTGGVVQDIKRIGTVFEADPGDALNDTITVSGVSYFNINSSRGTESNAAVWSEQTKSNPTLTVTGCTMNNTGATAGNRSWGITAYNLTATGNNIQGFDIGVVAYDGSDIMGNTIKRNGYGVSCNNIDPATVVNIAGGNNISFNTYAGIQVFQSHGIYNISGNIIQDNGSGGTIHDGIDINTWYATGQHIMIDGNLFVSSANEGDSVGQLYAINWYWPNSGTSKDIKNNTFLYTGTFSTPFPGNITVLPCDYAYGVGNYVGLMGINGNTSSKFTQEVYTVGTPALPATTVEQQNTLGYPVKVTISGGTVTKIAKGFTSGALADTHITAGTVVLQAGEYIAITYSVAPTWVWVGM